jgi:hypothetical protein
MLDVITDLHTSTAFDALSRIPVERRSRFIYQLCGTFSRVSVLFDPELPRQLLQFTVIAAYACLAFPVMFAQ